MDDVKDHGGRWALMENRRKIYTTFSKSDAVHHMQTVCQNIKLIDRWADGDNTITGVAIMQDGVKYFLSAPARHRHVVSLLEPPVRANSPRGFILNTGQFVTRKQARAIAVMNGQCPKPKLKEELYSEDLW